MHKIIQRRNNVQEGNENKDEKKKPRNDYTNLQYIYTGKIVVFTIIAVITLLQTRDDFFSLMVAAFTYSAGIVFDCWISIKTNNGPKTKTKGIKRIPLILSLITCGSGLAFALGGWILPKELEVWITGVIRVLMLSIGFLEPYTELRSNKPNDD